jgi:hypothetical protein
MDPIAARFVDRYMPNASPEERAEACQNLNRLVAVLVRVAEREAAERAQARTRADGTPGLESDSQHN